MAVHLSNSPKKNKQNGKGSKTLKTNTGSIEIAKPSDRTSSFEPIIVWLDAMHYKVKVDGKIVQRALYTILGGS